MSFEEVYARRMAARDKYCEFRKAQKCGDRTLPEKEAARCRKTDEFFVLHTFDELERIVKQGDPHKVEWLRQLAPALSCGAPSSFGERGDDPNGDTYELYRFQKLLQQEDVRKVVSERLSKFEQQKQPIPRGLQTLVASAPDFETFAAAVRAMSTALALESLAFLKALEPEFRAEESRPTKYSLALVSELPAANAAGAEDFLDWLRALLGATTLQGIFDRQLERGADRKVAVQAQAKACKQVGQQCDVVLELWFEGPLARARVHFVNGRNSAREDVQSVRVPDGCAARDCTESEQQNESNARMLVAREFVSKLSKKYAIFSEAAVFPHTTAPVALGEPPDPRVSLRAIGTPTTEQRALLGQAQAFSCSGSCGALFSKGLEERWTKQWHAGGILCSPASPLALVLTQTDDGRCSLSLGVGGAHVYEISTSVDEPGLAAAAGSAAGLTLSSVVVAWRAAFAEPQKGEPPQPPPAEPPPAPWSLALVSPALPWWADHPTSTGLGWLLAADAFVVSTTLISGVFTAAERNYAETHPGARPSANVGYTITVTGAVIALGTRLVFSGIRAATAHGKRARQ